VVLVFVLGSAMVSPGTAQTAPTAPEKRALAITIAGPRTVKSKSKTTIQIAMTNVSGRAVIFDAVPNAEYIYEAVVRDVHGSTAPYTEHGKETRQYFGPVMPIYSGPASPLEPRKTWKNELVVSDLYDLSLPGKYSVQVSCRGTISNTITMTIVP
jgi:hypothetical protein